MSLAVYFMKLLIIIFLSCKNIVMCAACRWPGHGACHSSCCLHFLTLFSGCAAALVRCGSHDAQSVYWKSGLFIAAAATHLAWHAPVSTRPGPVRTQQSGTTSLSPADIEYCVLILLNLNCDVNPQSGPIHALAFSLNDFFCLPSIHPRIPVYTLTLHSNTCVSRKK